MNMNPTDLQQVRSIPLFAGLTDPQLSCLGKIAMICQSRPVIKNRHRKIKLQRQRRDSLRNVPGARNPQRAWRRDRFAIRARIGRARHSVRAVS